MPWFDNQDDARQFVEQVACEMVSGERDAYDGGLDIWSTAMVLHDVPEWPVLLPFAELTDALENPGLPLDDVERGKDALRDAARRLLEAQSAER
jgi:hypothetical protein